MKDRRMQERENGKRNKRGKRKKAAGKEGDREAGWFLS